MSVTCNTGVPAELLLSKEHDGDVSWMHEGGSSTWTT